ncbi:MAG TPA: peroxiredoxin [Candidatus Acidoferrum sp.]|nr:peroxiredoxin [Candidatus Acidoferrum sp.]
MLILMAGIGAAAAILLGGARLVKGGTKAPDEGSAAPEFTLTSQEQKSVSLRDYRGKWVVVYFYPKDFTSGCTVEAHNFQRDLAEYEKRNTVIFGISTQDEKTHQAFCTKEGLSFRLLADTKGEVSKQYGSLTNLGVAKLSARHTFLIDPQGTIRKVWLNVDVQKHSGEILTALGELQKANS